MHQRDKTVNSSLKANIYIYYELRIECLLFSNGRDIQLRSYTFSSDFVTLHLPRCLLYDVCARVFVHVCERVVVIMHFSFFFRRVYVLVKSKIE